MKAIVKRCAGLDVHKKSVVATVLLEQPDGQIVEETRKFGTFPRDCRALAQWLASLEIELVAMESTGIYWKSVYAALEEFHLKTYVVNARHVKQIPGRKTDVKDSQWLASLARFGLLKGSFIPEKALRELRLVTRYRLKLKSMMAQEKNRLHKLLDDGGLRLGAVISDLHGVSAQAIIKGLIAGESSEQLLSHVKGRLKKKMSDLTHALEQPLTQTHLFLLEQIQTHLEQMEQECALLDQRITQMMEPYQTHWHILQTLPGIDACSAAALIAEFGVDLQSFGSSEQFCSWAGMCPGNNESAGKRMSGRTRKGNQSLRRTLCEVSHAAARTKECQFNGYYKGLVIRRGHKRAVVATGHKILRVIYNLFTHERAYRDPGIDYEKLVVKRNAPRWLSTLQKFGYIVQEPCLA